MKKHNHGPLRNGNQWSYMEPLSIYIYTLCVEDHFGDVFRERLFLVGNDQYNFQV